MMTGMTASRRLPLVLTVCALLVGVLGLAPRTPNAEASEITRPLPANMVDDERSAVSVVDRFWRMYFEQEFRKPYRSPRVIGPYNGNNGPSCGGQPSVPFNAAYCPPGDFLAWDEKLMASGYDKIGNPWIYLIIAHEWGHAVQNRLSRKQVSRAEELQADCLAGTALAGAAKQGWITWETGDSQRLGQGLTAVADDTPWTNPNDHGNAKERIDSYNIGAKGGPQDCLGRQWR